MYFKKGDFEIEIPIEFIGVIGLVIIMVIIYSKL